MLRSFLNEHNMTGWQRSCLSQSVRQNMLFRMTICSTVLFVLKTGCCWMDVSTSVCIHDYSTCWRRLNFWRMKGALKLVWQQVLVLLDHQGEIDLSLGNSDGSLIQSPCFQCTGWSAKHQRIGTNISLLTEKNRLPLTNMTVEGNRHVISSAESTLKKLRVGAKSRVLELNAEKGYDSAALRCHLTAKGIGTNIRVPKKLCVNSIP
jgi:hypothetical protein